MRLSFWPGQHIHFTIVDLIVLYLGVAYEGYLTAPFAFGSELRKSKKPAQQVGDLIHSVIGQRKARHTVVPIGHDPVPKIGRVDRHEGWSGSLTQQNGDGVILDDCAGAQGCDIQNASAIPAGDLLYHTGVLQLFIKNNHAAVFQSSRRVAAKRIASSTASCGTSKRCATCSME